MFLLLSVVKVFTPLFENLEGAIHLHVLENIGRDKMFTWKGASFSPSLIFFKKGSTKCRSHVLKEGFAVHAE